MNPPPSTILPLMLGDLSSPPPFVQRVYGEPLFHTEDEVVALAYAADGTVWTVEETGYLRQWSAEGRQLARSFLSDVETAWAFSADAQMLASGGDALLFWDVPTALLRGRVALPEESWVTCLAFARDGRFLASGHDDGKVRIWDPLTRVLLGEIDAHEESVSALAFTADGARLATAGEDRIIRTWDVATRNNLATLAGHTDRIPALAWHPSGDYLVSAGWDTTARVWQPPNPDPLMLLNSHSEQVYTLAFSPDGRLLACADSDQAIYLWSNPLAGQVARVLQGHGGEIHHLAFSADGSRLASGGEDHIVHVWDTQSGRLVAGPNPEGRRTIALIEGTNGTKVASTGTATLQLWDAETGQPLPSPCPDAAVLSIAASRDGKHLATGGPTPDARVWDTANWFLEQTLPHTRGPIPAMTFAPDSRTLATASASDGLIWVWRLGEPEAALVIPEAAETCTLEALAFHPDGNRLAVGGIDVMETSGSDGAVCVWDLSARDKLLAFGRGVTSLAFDPSGRFLAGGSLHQTVYVWDLETQKPAFEELKGHQSRVGAVAFSPDGSWLVSGSDDGTFKVWNAMSGKLLVTRHLDTAVQALAFSPDGRYLYTGNGNLTAYRLEMRRVLEE